MKSKANFIFLVTALSSLSASSALADGRTLSDFFQDWNLDTNQQNSNECHALLSALPKGVIPGVNGMLGPNYDASTAITFTFNDPPTRAYDYPPGVAESISLGSSPSETDDGTVTASLQGNQLKAVLTKKSLFFSRVSRTETFTLLSGGGLTYENDSKKEKMLCHYANAHPELVGRTEIGAILLINGNQAASCFFGPGGLTRSNLSDKPYAYEKCDLGKFIAERDILMNTEVKDEDVDQSSLATKSMELIRTTDKLHKATENYLARETEIEVVDAPVPDTTPTQPSTNHDRYPFSPYELRSFAVPGTTNGTIQFVYSQ